MLVHMSVPCVKFFHVKHFIVQHSNCTILEIYRRLPRVDLYNSIVETIYILGMHFAKKNLKTVTIFQTVSHRPFNK